MLNNHTKLLMEFSMDNLERITPDVKGWLCPLFIIFTLIIALATFLVNRAVFYTIKRLNSRAINNIIVPTLVISNVLAAPYLVLVVVRAIHYPQKDITGESFCYFHNFAEIWMVMLMQCQSFFVTFFRYICLFHDHILTRLGYSPKKFANIVLFGLLGVTITLSSCIAFGTLTTPSLLGCIGRFEVETFLKQNVGQAICNANGILLVLGCKISFAMYAIFSSNIPEMFLLYQCFKQIKEQTEASKPLISEKDYQRRRRDNGIVISISVLQWQMEVANLVFYLCYVFLIFGWSTTLDKFFNLYLFSFAMIIQPAFYLNGDATYRNNLANHGLIHALRLALFHPQE